jgi:hypothetical protein
MELHGVVTAARLWGHKWKGQRVLFNTDCQPVRDCINKGYSSVPKMCELLRELCTIAVQNDFVARAAHIAGVKNVFPDLLSRDRVQEFLARSNSSRHYQTHLPGRPKAEP